MSLAKHIFVRHSSEGHLRFAIPEALCQTHLAENLERELKRVEGVYRVDLYRKQQKLSIRYIEGVTHAKTVARALFDALDKIKEQASASGDIAVQEGEPSWVKSKYQEAKETITALGILAKGTGNAGNSTPLIPDKEKFVLEFFTDILVLYLIKLHWHLIMGHWIRNPWQYRSEWMATIYMIFLLVRSKKPKK